MPFVIVVILVVLVLLVVGTVGRRLRECRIKAITKWGRL
jgi:hypothetical protein